MTHTVTSFSELATDFEKKAFHGISVFIGWLDSLPASEAEDVFAKIRDVIGLNDPTMSYSEYFANIFFLAFLNGDEAMTADARIKALDRLCAIATEKYGPKS